jgi:hypothetical protein
MASQGPESGNSHNEDNLPEAGNARSVQPGNGKHPVAAARFILGTLAGFAMAGVLFFMLLALWSIIAGPFVRLQSASVVIAGALAASVVMTVWLYRAIQRHFS